MMTRSPRFLVLVLLIALLGGAPGCVVRARPVWVVDVAPPPPRAQVVHPRRGLVWIEGHWEWVGGRWVWRDGYWVRDRPTHVWTAGVWVQVGGQWRWRPGHWTERGRVRDHRSPARNDRPRVRDHR
jgi:hypothetical protein